MLAINLLLLNTAAAQQFQLPLYSGEMPAAKPPPDSALSSQNGKLKYYRAQFTFVGGKQAQGYVKSVADYYRQQVECYEQPPAAKPYPPLKGVSVERLQALTIAGRRYEALSVLGRPATVWAHNLVSAPGKAQLYYYAIARSLQAGPGAGMGGSYAECYWFVRLPGGWLQAVPQPRSEFAALMGQAFADYPELAARIKQEKPGTRPRDLPALLAEYNAHFAAK